MSPMHHTFGTWPSPFWLMHIDSTWRNGSEDVGWAGKGDNREQWLNGTSLQELYLTPSRMTQDSWDDVAAAAKWAHANADVLIDWHWVGGDPLALQAYGYAAWNPRKGTLMIRKPDDKPQSITLDAAKVFDLPVNAPRRYELQSPYKDQRLQNPTLEAGKEQPVILDPFEVLVFDATPNS